MCKPMNVVDLLSILPFYVELGFEDGNADGLVALRILRLCRLLRVFKLQKYNSGLTVFVETLILSSAALSVLGFVLAMLTIFFAALFFVFEGGEWYAPTADCGYGIGSCAQIFGKTCVVYDNRLFISPIGENGAYLRKDAYGELSESPFKSIFDSAWCVIATLTTVGYGERALVMKHVFVNLFT